MAISLRQSIRPVRGLPNVEYLVSPVSEKQGVRIAVDFFGEIYCLLVSAGGVVSKRQACFAATIQPPVGGAKCVPSTSTGVSE